MDQYLLLHSWLPHGWHHPSCHLKSGFYIGDQLRDVYANSLGIHLLFWMVVGIERYEQRCRPERIPNGMENFYEAFCHAYWRYPD